MKKKSLNLSTDQLKQIETEKKIGSVIQSSIKEGEKFVRFTVQKDIAKVYFPKITFALVSLSDLETHFDYLLQNGFIKQITESIHPPFYQCLKTWSSDNRPPMKTK